MGFTPSRKADFLAIVFGLNLHRAIGGDSGRSTKRRMRSLQTDIRKKEKKKTPSAKFTSAPEFHLSLPLFFKYFICEWARLNCERF